MKFLLAVLTLALFSANTFAGEGRRPEIKFVGLYDVSSLKTDDAAAQALLSSRADYGGGLLFEIPFGKVVGLEFGGLYGASGYKIASLDTEIYNKGIQIPLLFKIHIGNVFNFGLGGYYSMAMGKLKIKTAGTEVESDLESNQKSDYGALGSIGFDFMLGKKVSFIIEGRFAYGMKDMSSASTKDTFMHMQGLAGFGLHF